MSRQVCLPIHSMYAIYAYIDPPNHPNVGKYGIHGASGIYLSDGESARHEPRPRLLRCRRSRAPDGCAWACRSALRGGWSWPWPARRGGAGMVQGRNGLKPLVLYKKIQKVFPQVMPKCRSFDLKWVWSTLIFFRDCCGALRTGMF